MTTHLYLIIYVQISRLSFRHVKIVGGNLYKHKTIFRPIYESSRYSLNSSRLINNAAGLYVPLNLNSNPRGYSINKLLSYLIQP